jgi:hypothetical protein
MELFYNVKNVVYIAKIKVRFNRNSTKSVPVLFPCDMNIIRSLNKTHNGQESVRDCELLVYQQIIEIYEEGEQPLMTARCICH